MNETDHQALTLLAKTIYPYQPRSLSMPYLSIPFQWAKRKLMKVVGLNRWDFDNWLLALQAWTSEEGIYAFYLLKSILLPTSRLNYVSTAQRGRETSENSYCYLRFDPRNKYMKVILAELGMSKDA